MKELLLVGFFVNIGFLGLPTWENLAEAALLLLLLPVQAAGYWVILWGLGLRNRTAVLTVLLLANYSEFSLIIGSMGAEEGWLDERWMLSLVLAVSLNFVLAALFNPQSVTMATHWARKLPVRPPHKIHPGDRPIELGDAHAVVLGMGRVGQACYRELTEVLGETRVLGWKTTTCVSSCFRSLVSMLLKAMRLILILGPRQSSTPNRHDHAGDAPQHANQDTLKEIHASQVDTDKVTIAVSRCI